MSEGDDASVKLNWGITSMTSALTHMKVHECQMRAFLFQTLDYFMLCILLLKESHFLRQVQVLMGYQIQRDFISLPKDVLCSQCPKGRLFQVPAEARADEGRNGLKVFGCIAMSRMPNDAVPFQMCVG